MKNLCLFLALFLMVCTTSLAQGTPKNLSPDAAQQCNELTRLMAKNLYLYDLEYLKLKNLNEKTMLKVQQIQADYKGTPALQEAKLKEATAEFENELIKLLDQQQKVVLASYKIDASLWLDTPSAVKNMMSSVQKQ